MAPMSRNRAASRRQFIAAGLILSLVLLGFLAYGHFEALLRVGSRVEWWAVAAGLLCAAGSYAMIGLALGEVLGVLGHSLPFSAVQGIALVSTTANYFVSSGGVSGFAVKAHLLRKRRVPYGATVTASVVSSAILYFVLAVIIAQGLLYLALRLRGADVPLLQGVLGLSVVLVSSVTLMRVIFDHELRGRVTGFCFHAVNRLVFWFSKTQIPREDFIEFEGQFAAGLEKVREAKGRLLRTILYTTLDWSLALLSLHFCFRAVGVLLPFGELVAGFTVGMAATLIPILPGGLGAMEGGMAAVYETLGVNWEAAFVAVLLFRLCYYLLPGLASMFVLWGLKVSEPGA